MSHHQEEGVSKSNCAERAETSADSVPSSSTNSSSSFGHGSSIAPEYRNQEKSIDELTKKLAEMNLDELEIDPVLSTDIKNSILKLSLIEKNPDSYDILLRRYEELMATLQKFLMESKDSKS